MRAGRGPPGWALMKGHSLMIPVGEADHSTGGADASPVVKSFEPGEELGYCYVDDLFFESL